MKHVTSDFARKFSKPDVFQRNEGGKLVKSSNRESVKIPLFNPSDPFKEKIKALVDAIVSWWNSKADTKAFLRALAGAITKNFSAIDNLPDGGALTFTFAVPKTNDRFDRLFVTLTLKNDGLGYILQHEEQELGKWFTLKELKGLKAAVDNYSYFDIKALGGVVREMKAYDIRNKLALTHAVAFSDKTEYDIASYAKHKTTDPDLQEALTKGMATIAKLGYSFSNAQEVVDNKGNLKHSAGKIKFDRPNVVFADSKITLTNDLQLIKLCEALMEQPANEQHALLEDIQPIISYETYEAMRDKIATIVCRKIRQKFTEGDQRVKDVVEMVKLLMFPPDNRFVRKLMTLTDNTELDHTILPNLQTKVSNKEIEGVAPDTAVDVNL